jgi:hypothetical protein
MTGAPKVLEGHTASLDALKGRCGRTRFRSNLGDDWGRAWFCLAWQRLAGVFLKRWESLRIFFDDTNGDTAVPDFA